MSLDPQAESPRHQNGSIEIRLLAKVQSFVSAPSRIRQNRRL